MTDAPHGWGISRLYRGRRQWLTPPVFVWSYDPTTAWRFASFQDAHRELCSGRHFAMEIGDVVTPLPAPRAYPPGYGDFGC